MLLAACIASQSNAQTPQPRQWSATQPDPAFPAATIWEPAIAAGQARTLQGDVDQFLPTVTVDDSGRIHVIFYDDRDFPQPDSEASPKFNVYYAVSIDHGATFQADQPFAGSSPVGDPAEPILDIPLFVDNPGGFQKIGEYIGISAFGNQVWTAYPGTSVIALQNQPTHNPNVIWSTPIDLP